MGPQIRGLVLLTLPIGSSLCAVVVVLSVVCWAPSRWCGRDGWNCGAFFIALHGRFWVGFFNLMNVFSFWYLPFLCFFLMAMFFLYLFGKKMITDSSKFLLSFQFQRLWAAEDTLIDLDFGSKYVTKPMKVWKLDVFVRKLPGKFICWTNYLSM